MMGGALGLAILASLAASHTNSLLASGGSYLATLNEGYHAAFFVGALVAACAGVLGAVFLRTTTTAAQGNVESAQ
jgi:hypothetical protein